MSENKFEKTVQEEMQGFKLKPSEVVWPKIEERIREKKKRRIFFILFFLAGLALLGYWQRDYFFGGNKNNIAQNKNQDIKTEILNETKNDISAEKKISPVNDNKPEKRQMKEEKKTEKVERKPATKIFWKTAIENHLALIKKVLPTKQKAAKEITKTPKQEEKSLPVVPALIEKQEQVVANIETPVKNAIVIQDVKEQSNVSENNPDSVIKIAERIVVEEIKKDADTLQVSAKPDTAIESVKSESAKKNSSSKKWKWEFLFSPGISSLSKNIISLNMSKSADLYANPNTTGSATYTPPAPASISKSGFAFQSGAFLVNQFTPRSSISIGLQYAYYSQHISVGKRKDSVLRLASQTSVLLDANYAYAAASASNNFTNRYHFIEIPFILQVQLNKKNANPFKWNMGIAAGKLISAKTLAYDTSFGGIYYDNKKHLNKSQLSFSTGFAWSFLNNKKIKASLGPIVDYHLSSLLDNPFDKKNHLLFVGIRTTINFSKK